MDCPNWPPPLPSLPLYPPCRPRTPTPPPPEIKLKESQIQEWWNEHLGPALDRISGAFKRTKGITYELTSLQRRELLPIRTPTKEDKLIWSVPLPEGSYPNEGLPIWERLYLDRKLPMLKCPPNALVFARQQIGKKLWKDTEGQEFILYDPNSYEVAFSYENIHDPNLTTYYKGKEIRGFLLNLGDANEDGWGICSLKRFNQYRKYLKRVHLSLVHSEMKRQELLKDEIHQLKEYKRITNESMELWERKTMMDEMRAAITEALKLERENRINRLVANIQKKNDRVQKLYEARAMDKEIRRQKGLKLLAEQELKNKIAKEIKRRKKLATLRMWHNLDKKTARILRKQREERVRQRAEKVRIRWQNKIENLKKMIEREDNYLKLQEKVKEENIQIRNARTERLKQKQKETFHEIRQEGLRKKALEQKERSDKRMERAITDIWLRLNTNEYDLHTELYRVKKSINSTMAELLSSQMEDDAVASLSPDRLSIIYLSRNRIQREQKIPLQVSFAIDSILETTIKKWASSRLSLVMETIITQVKENGEIRLANIKVRHKDLGIPTTGGFKSSEPKGKIYQPDPKEEKPPTKDKLSVEQTLDSTTVDFLSQDEKSEKEIYQIDSEKESSREVGNKVPKAVIPNYVHFGLTTTFEYPIEYEPTERLKSIKNRPKTPMPTQEVLCEAGFTEEKLFDALPTFSDDVMEMKEKKKFRKTFTKVAIQLFKRSIDITKHVLEPVTRFRSVTKLAYLGSVDRLTLTNTLCELIMNKEVKSLSESEEFDWLAKMVAKEAIREVLNPPEFSKDEDDGVARTKIMFYAPKPKKNRKL